MSQVEPVIKNLQADRNAVSWPTGLLPDGCSSKSPKFNEIRSRYEVVQSQENVLPPSASREG